MDDNKIIDTEFTEVKEDAKKERKIVEVNIATDDLLDLLSEANDLVDGYSLIYKATKTIASKLQNKGYPTEQILGAVNVLCERASSKASAKDAEKERGKDETLEE